MTSGIKILIACEHSGTMLQAFSNYGFDVMSADLKKANHNGNHYQGNIFDLDLNSFHFIMCFWPCTYFAKAQLYRCVPGSTFYNYQVEQSELVKQLLALPINHFALENPIGALPRYIGHPTQLVYPYYFGDPYRKEICLWLKNLPPLMSTMINPVRKSIQNHVNSRMSPGKKSEIKSSWSWYPHMAKSIAEQWSKFLIDYYLHHEL